MTNTKRIAVTAAFLSAAFAGCHAEQAVAPRNSVVAQPLQSFPREALSLKDVTIFFWPDGVSRDEVKAVLQASDKYDELNAETTVYQASQEKLVDQFAQKTRIGDDGTQVPENPADYSLIIDPAKAAIADLDAVIADSATGLPKAKAEKEAADAALKQAQDNLDDAKKKNGLADDEKSLKDLQTQLGVAQTDADKKALQDKIDALKAQMAPKNQALEPLKDEISRRKNAVGESKKKVSRYESAPADRQAQQDIIDEQMSHLKDIGLDQAYLSYADVTAKRNAVEAELQHVKDTLIASTVAYENPSLLRFVPKADGSYTGVLLKWDAHDGKGTLTYTTSDLVIDQDVEHDPRLENLDVTAASVRNGMMQNVTYTELGGTYEFTVVSDDVTYEFKLSRTKYGVTDKKNFKGDVTMIDAACKKLLDSDPKAPCKRRGAIKAADKLK